MFYVLKGKDLKSNIMLTRIWSQWWVHLCLLISVIFCLLEMFHIEFLTKYTN